MLINEDEPRIYQSTTKWQRIVFIINFRYNSFHECHIDFNISSYLNIMCCPLYWYFHKFKFRIFIKIFYKNIKSPYSQGYEPFKNN